MLVPMVGQAKAAVPGAPNCVTQNQVPRPRNSHLAGADERLVRVAPLLEGVGDWRQYLSQTDREADLAVLRCDER